MFQFLGCTPSHYIRISGGGTPKLIVFKAVQAMAICGQGREPVFKAERMDNSCGEMKMDEG